MSKTEAILCFLMLLFLTPMGWVGLFIIGGFILAIFGK